MTITHKILLNKDTGKVVQPVYLVENERPEPPDCIWHFIEAGTWLHDHFCCDPPIDISHIDIEEAYFDFESNTWNEVPSSSVPSFSKTKFNRNELLKQTDRTISALTDIDKINSWALYRQQLRNMFVGVPEDVDWNMIVFPRNPDDIAVLKKLAAAGDADAAAIIKKDKL